MTALWDDEHGIVHKLVASDAGGIPGWFITCSGQGPMALHSNARKCVTTTCMWCALGVRGPYRFDQAPTGRP